MTHWLLFTLYAPLASWGEIAVGEIRGSWDRPSRSAILGLLAAALGLEREAQADHDSLSDGYGVAVRLDRTGDAIADYHTAQTVGERDVRRAKPSTRRQLLAAGAPNTILSRRTLRQDALATVAIWAKPDARWSLDALANALLKPQFVLYAGRKANALGWPLAPEIVEAATLAAAFASRAPLPDDVEALGPMRPRRGEMWGREVSHDPLPDAESGMRLQRTDTRRDDRPHRARWQFAERAVQVSLLPEPNIP